MLRAVAPLTSAAVNQQITAATATVPVTTTGGVYNQASLGSGLSVVILVSGGVVQSIVSVVNGGSGYAVGDILLLPTGNADAIVRVTNVIGGVVQSGGVSIVYGGTGYTTGITSPTADIPPAQRTIVFTGVLTSNVTLIVQNGTFLAASRRFEVVNNTTGAFTATVFLSNGAGGTVGNGVVVPQGTNASAATLLFTDGVNDVWSTVTTAALHGTVTNDNPNAGCIGEYVTASFNTVALSTGVTTNLTTISLTAGDWDVTGGVIFSSSVSGAITNCIGGASGTSVTAGALGTYFQLTQGSTIASVASGIPVQRFSLAATTTVYFIGVAVFASGTATGSGIFRARRVR